MIEVNDIPLRTLPSGQSPPAFDAGWVGAAGERDAFISYAPPGPPSANWSAELEALHEGSSLTHFLDVATRQFIIDCLVAPRGAVVADLGCSTGYLLADMRAARPDLVLVGIDLIDSGLRKAHELVPDVRLIQADICELPLEDAGLEAAVSTNLLEHVGDDRLALRELHRVLAPGARGVLVVPAAPGTYDYYDRFLGHERRYGRRELAAKAAEAGLEVLKDVYIGSLIFPAFWLVKQRNRRRLDHLEGADLEARVAADIAGTNDSVVGRWCSAVERRLIRQGLRIPFGVRNLVVVCRPGQGT